MVTSLLIAVLALESIGLSSSSEWFVAKTGTRNGSCGLSSKDSCICLQTTINKAKDGDEILLEYSKTVYDLCAANKSDVLIKKSLSISGTHSVNGYPKVGCSEMDNFNATILTFKPPDLEVSLSLKDIVLINGTIIVESGTLNLSRVTLQNTVVESDVDTCIEMSLIAKNTVWDSVAPCTQSGMCRYNQLGANNVNLNLWRCEIMANGFVISGTGQLNVSTDNSTFDGGNGVNTGIQIDWSGNGDIQLIKSRFQNIVSPNLTGYMGDLYHSAVYVKRFNKSGVLTMNISESFFVENERGLTIIGDVSKVDIDKCHFEQNAVMYSGAAILSMAHSTSVTTITDSRFRSNKAGYIRKRFRRINRNYLSVEDDTIIVNTTMFQGSMQAKGQGGAIKQQGGLMYITDCKFYVNTANIQGGTIMIDKNAVLVVRDTLMHGPQSGYHPLLGDILYSKGTTKLYNVKLIAHHAEIGTSVIEHVGDQWSIRVSGIELQCPINHKLDMTEISTYKVTPEGMRSSTNQYDQLVYYCQPCPVGQYSTKHSWVKNLLAPKKSDYLSLAFGNNTVEQPEYSGTYNLKIIKCQPCPKRLLIEKEIKYLNETEIPDWTNGGEPGTLYGIFYKLCPIPSTSLPSTSCSCRQLTHMTLLIGLIMLQALV